MNRTFLVLFVLILACSLVAGCAVIYTADKSYRDGTRVKEFGLLGGIVPIYRHTSSTNARTGREIAKELKKLKAKK